ncbi:hypothetical protein [Pedobacter kyonggii]|uniref:SGNH/GDSL hydrolase family protein n=1 Tax=Pedobacter kyonggii TaxID=1926871 RepID=A0A4Q9HGE8_9SPHI|nr:hypothetical protein [Pedobacter kyonggii]TBO44306.1 hypothetical protein EYS08_03055 [Pedobacter kyonggii]
MNRTFKYIGISLLFFFIVEVFLRFSFHEQLKDRIYPLIYQPDSLIDYRFIPNTHSKISGAGISLKDVYINSKGYSFKEFKSKKQLGVYRIIIVGASSSGNIYMNGRQNYSDKLQKSFDKMGCKVEIINCSIDGSGRQKANLDLINTEILQFDPDLIILEFSLPFMSKNLSRAVYKDYVIEYEANSERSREFGIQIVDYLNTHKYLTCFYDASYLVRLLCKYYIENNDNDIIMRRMEAYKTKIIRPDPIGVKRAYVCYPISTTMKLLKETRDNVAVHNCKLLLMNSVIKLDKNNPVDNELKDSLDKNRFEYFFPGLEFKDIHKSLPDHHLNEKGHEMIAKALYIRLKNYVTH